MKQYVLSCAPYGTFLGIVEGVPLWSNAHRYMALPRYAKAFKDVQEVQKLFGTVFPIEIPSAARVTEVECSALPGYAHIGECVHAGIEMWNCEPEGAC